MLVAHLMSDVLWQEWMEGDGMMTTRKEFQATILIYVSMFPPLGLRPISGKTN